MITCIVIPILFTALNIIVLSKSYSFVPVIKNPVHRNPVLCLLIKQNTQDSVVCEEINVYSTLKMTQHRYKLS